MRVNGSTWGSVFGRTGMDPLHPQVEKKKLGEKNKLIKIFFCLVSFFEIICKFVKVIFFSQRKKNL